MKPIVSCYACEHLYLKGNQNCKAFPNGIPADILSGEERHVKSVEGDHGITFTPFTEKKVAKGMLNLLTVKLRRRIVDV